MNPALLICLASTPPTTLAPKASQLDESIARTQALLGRASIEERRWSKAQRKWVDVEGPEGQCKPAIACAQIVLQIHESAQAARRWTQSARAEWQRAVRIANFRPVGTLIRGARRVRQQQVKTSLDRATRRYLARNSWDRLYVRPWAARNGVLMRRLSSHSVSHTPRLSPQ